MSDGRDPKWRPTCGKCGRFVPIEGADICFDDYNGGYEDWTVCKPGKGCQKKPERVALEGK